MGPAAEKQSRRMGRYDLDPTEGRAKPIWQKELFIFDFWSSHLNFPTILDSRYPFQQAAQLKPVYKKTDRDYFIFFSGKAEIFTFYIDTIDLKLKNSVKFSYILFSSVPIFICSKWKVVCWIGYNRSWLDQEWEERTTHGAFIWLGVQWLGLEKGQTIGI